MGLATLWREITAKLSGTAGATPPLTGKELMTTEHSPRKKDTSWVSRMLPGGIATEDPVLTYQTLKSTSEYRYTFGLYDEAIDKDAHLGAVLQQRKLAVLSNDQIVNPGDTSDEGKYAANFIKEVLFNQIDLTGGDCGFQRDLNEMLDAVLFGLNISEVVWDSRTFKVPNDEGRGHKREWFIPVKLMQRHLRRFRYDTDNRLRLITDANPCDGDFVPDYKYLEFRPYARYEDPWGYPLLRRVWWLTWMKRINVRYWAQYGERYANPLLTINPKDASLTDDEAGYYLEFLKYVQQETGIVNRGGVTVDALQLADQGSTNNYYTFAQWCNDEISKAIVGQNLTSTSPEGGNLSLGEIHERVSLSIQAQDARALEALINGTLIPWIMAFNLPGYPMPKFEIVTAPPRDVEKELINIKAAMECGGMIHKRELYERTGFEEAVNEEDALQLAPAPYTMTDPNMQPSQQTGAKTKQKQVERDRKKPGSRENPGPRADNRPRR